MKLPTLASLEAIAAAEPDFVCIDMCNGWLSIERVADLLSLRPRGVARYVRLAAGATTDVAGQLLDAGADGLVFAHVSSADEARKWVEATLFPPHGTRGMGSTGRAGRWGFATRADYLSGGDPGSASRMPVAIMIEDRAALDQLDKIAAVTGVDQLVVGSADLGQALQSEPAEFELALDAVARACAANGLSAAVALGTADRVTELVQRGYDTVYLSNDLTLLAKAMQQSLAAARGGGRH